MKNSIYILTFLLTVSVFGQNKDRRAELDIKGSVNEISVSPDEKIWLTTAIGNSYFTNNIDSNWHYGISLYKGEENYSLNNPSLKRISFFNKDTAILTGQISFGQKTLSNDGYYRTTDAGKKWELLDFGGNSPIYTIFTNKEGKAWMGGLSKALYYSNNFGKSWISIKLPYKSCDRTYGIFMEDSMVGVVGSDENEILSTKDNWKSVSHIETPLDQKKG